MRVLFSLALSFALLTSSVQAVSTHSAFIPRQVRQGAPIIRTASTAQADALTLSGLPLYHQGYNDCGPASLAMVLGYYGLNLSVSDISHATKPNQQAYMTVNAISPLVGQYGLETAVVHGGQISQLQKMVALGVPTIVLQYYIQVGKVPHFRVVQGFDRAGRWLYVADPLAGYVRIGYDDFDTLWNTQSRTFIAVYPPQMRSQVLEALRS